MTVPFFAGLLAMTVVVPRFSYLSGVLLAIAGTFLFALKSIFIKMAYAAGVDAETLLTLRMLLSAPFYLVMLLWLRSGQSAAWPSELSLPLLLRLLGYGFFGYYLASFLDLWGLELISAQLERLTLFTYPALIALLAWLFLGERLTWRIMTALLFCYLGIWVIYGREQLVTNPDQVVKGVALVVGSALSYAIYVVLAKPLLSRLGSRFFTSVAMLGSTLFVMIHFLLARPLSAIAVSGEIWGYGLLLAFVCTVLPSFMVAEAINRIGPTRATILGTVGPVFTLVLTVVWLDEPTSWYHLLGMLLVIGGVGLVSRR